VPSRLFTPSPHQLVSNPRVEAPDEIRDVLAVVRLRGTHSHELVIGLDIGRVIRVVGTRELPPRARAQLAYHEGKRAHVTIHADEIYVMDVQAVERQPDTPGADDPLFLYGVLRGAYPDALAGGVTGLEGKLATTRGPLLDGLAGGIERSFVYETGRCGTTCTHAALPIDVDRDARAVVLAFPLVPMGDDGSNELVAAQLIHDVLGAMRSDLGDDLSNDPVPVPSREVYERELVAAGWTIKGDVATHTHGRGRLASLFTPGKRQKLPAEVRLEDYVPLIGRHLGRLPNWPNPARGELHAQLGLGGRPRRPTRPMPTVVPAPPSPPRARPPTQPPAKKGRAPTSPPPPPPHAKHRRRRATKHTTPPPARTVAAGLTSPKPKEWIRQFIEGLEVQGKPRPRVTTPDRAAGGAVPDWMMSMIESEFPDDD